MYACLLQMVAASTAGGGLLSEDSSWGRLLVQLPLKHPSKANKQAGEIELEVRLLRLLVPRTCRVVFIQAACSVSPKESHAQGR